MYVRCNEQKEKQTGEKGAAERMTKELNSRLRKRHKDLARNSKKGRLSLHECHKDLLRIMTDVSEYIQTRCANATKT